MIVPFHAQKEVEPVCSFCKTPKSEAKMMFAGIDKHICDKCVVQAKQRLSESSKQDNK